MRNLSRQEILRLKLDSGNDLDLFMSGACFYLALEIHDQTGFPLRYAKLINDENIAHVWCITPNEGTGIDACGKRSEKEIRREKFWDKTQKINRHDFEGILEGLRDGDLAIACRERAKTYIQTDLKGALNL